MIGWHSIHMNTRSKSIRSNVAANVFDKLINSIAERVTVRVMDMLERRLPDIVATVTQVALREIMQRLGIPQLPQSQLSSTVNDVLTRLGIRR